MQKIYNEKDKFLLSVGKKIRYKPLSPENYFFSLPVVKNILSTIMKNEHRNLFIKEVHKKKLEDFEIKRNATIKKDEIKKSKNMELIQKINPHYADFYITAYHQKGTNTEEKVEIVKALSKYDSEKIDVFFYKLNDSERNNQVGDLAFNYLRSTGKYVKLRKKFKGNKKSYMIETTSFDMTPEDLYKRINSRGLQIKKSFDVFISHSFSDQANIIELFKALNEINLTCYCDWTNDNDFLKRNMASKYTEEVLKKRIEQSTYVLYAKSDSSTKSKWVDFELKFASSIEKDIKVFNINSIAENEISRNVKELITQINMS